MQLINAIFEVHKCETCHAIDMLQVLKHTLCAFGMLHGVVNLYKIPGV